MKTAAIYRIHEQGSLNNTENRFDLAIRGNGYFRIRLPSGEDAYTRGLTVTTTLMAVPTSVLATEMPKALTRLALPRICWK